MVSASKTIQVTECEALIVQPFLTYRQRNRLYKRYIMAIASVLQAFYIEASLIEF